MSLIIAKRIDDEVFIISDTKFTYKDPETNKDKWYTKAEEYLGGLKSVLITPGLCVCFAGEVEHAKDAIENILKRNINIFDKNHVIDYFLHHHLISKHETDYLVICDVGFLEIFKISNGVVKILDIAWIGDYDAFAKVQQIISTNSHQKSVETGKTEVEIVSLGNNSTKNVCNEISKYMRVFDVVINDPSIKSVDGIKTLTRFSKSNSYYSEYLIINGIPKKTLSGATYFGDAIHGTDSKHVGICSSDGIGVYCLYYYAAKFGVIYNPLESFTPEIVKATSIEEFKNKAITGIRNHQKLMLKYQARF